MLLNHAARAAFLSTSNNPEKMLANLLIFIAACVPSRFARFFAPVGFDNQRAGSDGLLKADMGSYEL